MIYDNNDNNDNNSGNIGNKGKFSERLNRMRQKRTKKQVLGDELEKNKSTLRATGENIFKILLSLPSVIYTNVVYSDNKTEKKDVEQQLNGVLETNDNHVDEIPLIEDYTEVEISEIEKEIKVNKIREIDISLLTKQREYLASEDGYFNISRVNKTVENTEIELKKTKIQKEIIDLIRKKLVKNINELEILQSELYVLNQMGLSETYLDNCEQDIKEIKKLLSKVKALKEKYDYLKDDVDFQYMLEYGDDFLIDKILELKEICSIDEVKHTIGDYKILDEYKFLYLEIDKLNENMIKLEDEKNKKVEELKQRDIDFDKLKEDIYNVDKENDRYNSFVKEQELVLREIENNVSKIKSYEDVTYKLKGFNQLLGNSFKYLGLLLANPLKGLIPGIATQTVITKNLVQNLYNNLEWEENKKRVYEAVDYSSSINFAINNLDNTASLVDSTLEDIVRLKNKYKKDFSGYESSFSGYQDAIKKINKIENAILCNKIKIEVMRQRMKEKERENSNKLKMIKKLNDSDNR